MQTSFWTGAVGAQAFNNKLAVTANNLANINTTGYKPKDAVFTELINYNLNHVDDTPEAQAGDSAAVSHTNTNFNQSAFAMTGIATDYAIGTDNAFFMLRDPGTNEISFTRNGHFHSAQMPDGKYFLMTEAGKYVLDQNQQPIEGNIEDIKKLNADFARMMSGEEQEQEQEEPAAEDDVEKPFVAAYTMAHPSRMYSKGDNEYYVRPGDTENTPRLMRDAQVKSGVLEDSGTDLAKEMTRIIESQRAFSYALKMVTTSDEIETTINGLRS